MKECPNCHNANKYGDYEGPTCQVCLGDGFVPDEPKVGATNTDGVEVAAADMLCLGPDISDFLREIGGLPAFQR